MKQISTLAIGVVTAILCLSCGEAPEVFQGTVSGNDQAAKVLIVKDERQPYNEVSFSLDNAEFGKQPAIGDSVRLSYRKNNGKFIAIRIMDLRYKIDSSKSGKK
jgi:hypothetical protein